MKNNKVVYVDDEKSNLLALKRLFRNESIEFITFDSPVKALREIEIIQPAVVISDQCMPDMKGTVLLEHVQKMLPSSIRIILTGHADLEAAMEAINRNHVYGFIQKPWDDDDLLNQVRAALEHQDSIHCLRTMVDALLDEILDNEKAMKSIRKLAATVYNELDQPLMVINGYLQLMKQYYHDDEIPGRYLDALHQQVARLALLAKKMNSIAHKAPGQPPQPKAGNSIRPV